MSDPTDKIGYEIKSLKITLKQLEPAIKGKDLKGRLFLIDGNNSPRKSGVIPVTNGTVFRMRCREAWANWLFCAVLCHAEGKDYTFQDDEGDGIIVNRTDNFWFPVEHVSAMDYTKGEKLPKGEDRVIWAINKKIEKSKKYADYSRGKTLIVFMDGAEKWYPNRVGRTIAGTHTFARVYCIALTSSPEVTYRYSVSDLRPEHSPTFIVEINKDFTDWKVTQIQ